MGMNDLWQTLANTALDDLWLMVSFRFASSSSSTPNPVTKFEVLPSE